MEGLNIVRFGVRLKDSDSAFDSKENQSEKSYSPGAGQFGDNAWKRGCLDRPSKTDRDAHRGLSLRQLSVQHSEGREPSRLRTESKRDSDYRHQKGHWSFHAQAR